MAKKQKKAPAEAADSDDGAPAAEEVVDVAPEKKGKKKEVAKKAPAESKAAGAKRDATEVFLERISHHSAYFDNLVDLFPARVYFTAEDTGDEGNRFRQKAGERAKAKLTAKENSKKAKRLKLDPDRAKPTSELVKERAEQEEARGRRGGGDSDDDDDDDSDDGADENEVPKKRARPTDQKPKPELQWKVSGGGEGEGREDLMARLQKRIEEARAKRNAEEQTKRVQKAQQWRADTLGSPMPGQKTPGKGKKGGATPGPAATPAATTGAAKTPAAAAGKPQPTPAAASANPELSVQFGRIEGIGKEGRREKKRKRQVSARDPTAALEKIEAAKAEVEAAGGKQTAEGQKLLQRQSWSSALARATGEKVLDDPRLLKKSIKRAEAQKRKSAEQWKERVHQQKYGQEQRQQKRTDNLKGRADEKAAKAVERREKKLMRPGFEGRLGDRALNAPKAGGGTPGMK